MFERMRGSEQFVRPGVGQGKIDKWHHFDAADEVDRWIDNQTVLGISNRDCEIRDDGIFRIGFTAVAVQASRNIDCENGRVLLAATLVDFLGDGADRLAQERFGAESKQSVEHDDTRAMVDRSRIICRRITQCPQFFLRELAAFLFRVSEVDVALPAGPMQMSRRDQGVAAVMTFPGVNRASARARKKLPDGARDSRAGLVHQRFDFDTAGESGFFGRSHLRRADDWRVQINSPVGLWTIFSSYCYRYRRFRCSSSSNFSFSERHPRHRLRCWFFWRSSSCCRRCRRFLRSS